MLKNKLLRGLDTPDPLTPKANNRIQRVNATIFLMNIYKGRLERLLEYYKKIHPEKFPKPKEKKIGVLNRLLQLGGKTRKVRKVRKSKRYSRRR